MEGRPSRTGNEIFADLRLYTVVFTLLFLYNWFTLAEGFAPGIDEGYLQSLGMRILQGDIPHRDFYFLRTPLSIYIQAGWLYLLADQYTVLFARVVAQVQLFVMIIMASRIYRRRVNRGELFLLLLFSYGLLSALLPFPWYSYDGLLFGVLSLYTMYRRQFAVAGVAMVLAFLCKQNYIAVLPLTVGTAFIIRYVTGEWPVLDKPAIRQLLFGAGGTAAALIILLVSQDVLADFWNNVFVLPRLANDVGWRFALIQDLPTAIERTWPFAAVIGALFFARRAFVLAVLTIMVGIIYYHGAEFVYDISFYSFAVILVLWVIAVVLFTKHRVEAPVGATPLPDCHLLFWIGSSIVLLYMTQFNYGGLLFATMGAGIVLPWAYIALRDHLPFRAAALVAVAILLGIGVVGWIHKYNYVYHEAARDQLTVEFTGFRLDGIRSRPVTVKNQTALLQLIADHSHPTDTIFVYPNFPAIYYLTDRPSASRILWFIDYETTEEMHDSTIAEMIELRPALIALDPTVAPESILDLKRKGEYDWVGSGGRIAVWKRIE